MPEKAVDRRGLVQLVLLGLLGLDVGALVAAAYSDLLPARVAIPAGALVGAILLPIAQLAAWRSVGGRAWSAALRSALRDGRLPDGAEPRQWIPRLERVVRDLGTARWRWLVLALPLVMALRDLDARTPVWRVAVSAGIGLAVAASVRAWARYPVARQRARALIRPLEQQWSAELRARSGG